MIDKALAEAVLDYALVLELDTVHSKSHHVLHKYREQFGRNVFDQAKAKHFLRKDAVRWQQGSAVMWIIPK
jgi:hypothetical protein